MTEIATYQPTTNLTEQMDYAKAVSSAALLPQAYRGKPADIMLAVGLGQAMGLSPAESLYRIDVIQGKPTASAELIAANVRKAGHILRLRVDEDAVSATCTIIRADDPDYEHTVTRDRAWAQTMGLLSKDNYKKQPATMLGWRAVTACARMACPEALYGVAHTADEMDDLRPRVQSTEPATGANRMGAMLGMPPTDAELANEGILLNTSSPLAKAMYAAIRDAGITEDFRIPFICQHIGRDIDSTKQMTEDEARKVLDAIDELPVAAEVVEEPALPLDGAK